MTLKEKVLKLQTYKMFEGEDTVYVERDDILELLEQDLCEDAISRQDVWFTLTNGAYPDETTEQFIDRIAKEIENKPPVYPKPKTGHWKRVELGMFDSVSIRWECSECKKSDKFRSNFCFNCGAKMESEG